MEKPNYSAQVMRPEFSWFTSHRRVRAALVTEVLARTGDHAKVGVGLHGVIQYDPNGKPTPQIGWWVIGYADGYISFCPPEAFAKGYVGDIPGGVTSVGGPPAGGRARAPLATDTMDADVLEGTKQPAEPPPFRPTVATLHPSTFQYLKPTAEQIATMDVVRSTTANYARFLEVELPAGPDKTYVMRKLRELAMWANIAITREADGTPRA